MHKKWILTSLNDIDKSVIHYNLLHHPNIFFDKIRYIIATEKQSAFYKSHCINGLLIKVEVLEITQNICYMIELSKRVGIV